MLVPMIFRTQHQTSTTRRLAAVAALPVAAVLALAGCSSDDDDADRTDRVAGAGATSGPATGPATGGTTAASAGSTDALLAAAATAREDVGSGTVLAVEWEQDGSGHEVLVVTKDGTEHEVRTDADGTAVVGTPQQETADADDRAEHERFVAAADLDVERAVRALTDLHDGAVTEIGLDDHRGAVVWEGDVVDASGTKHSVRVDAGSGDVVTDRVDTDTDTDD